MVLTTGHLVYFEDKAARDKEKPIKGAIALEGIKGIVRRKHDARSVSFLRP